MSTQYDPIGLTDSGDTIRSIGQELVPFDIPLGVPLVNPLSQKQLRFRKEYEITGVTVDEAVTGVLFGNYRPFMDVQEERYSRRHRTRHLIFNPFTRELEQIGRQTTGEIGEKAGRGAATLMGAALGLIEWTISVNEGSTAERVGIRFGTKAALFSGHFYINAKATDRGVILEDDWTPEGGANMRTGFLMMANLVLLTHPKGFEQIADAFVTEVTRARTSGAPYTGEIGPPSIDEDASA
jgi:uncharacterized membrane protein YgdD (TMEM256/DUF423 family)